MFHSKKNVSRASPFEDSLVFLPNTAAISLAAFFSMIFLSIFCFTPCRCSISSNRVHFDFRYQDISFSFLSDYHALMKDIHITIIGGGSRLWAISFMKDLTLRKDISGVVTLYDIDREASRRNVSVGMRMLSVNNDEGRFLYKAEDNLDKALEGADLVIIAIEPGRIKCRKADLLLPREYGIIQTVGDTTGPGGLIRARRAVPLFYDMAKHIEKVSPEAWVINYTNPMTLCTAALYRGFPKIKAFGCCHEVFHSEDNLCRIAEKRWGVLPSRRELDVDITGVNHFTFITRAFYKDHDLLEEVRKIVEDKNTFSDHTTIAEEREKNEKWFECDSLIAYSFFKAFGVLGAAGDRHLAEFVPWFLSSEEYLKSLGVICTPYSWRERNDREKKAKVFTDEELKVSPSGEEGVDIMTALLGGGDLKTNMNMPNRGQISYLPEGRIVESMGLITRDKVSPVVSLDPPEALESLIRRISDEQEGALNAILEGDDDALFSVFLTDPLVRLPLPRARELFIRMIDEGRLQY